jgi:hypothetical protein
MASEGWLEPQQGMPFLHVFLRGKIFRNLLLKDYFTREIKIYVDGLIL